MKYRKLGKSGIDVSITCMGCWQISSKTSDYWQSQEVSDFTASVHAAMEQGVNFFDTAEDYDNGNSEEALGKALDKRRGEVVVATKANPAHLADVTKACEGSLRRLKTDYIDLYQIHYPSPDVPAADALDAMEKLKSQGKVRAIGLSNFGASYLADLPSGRAVSNQLPYSLLWRAIEYEILPRSGEKDLCILAYSSLMQGLLAGRYQSPDEVGRGAAVTRLFNSRRGGSHGENGCEAETFRAIEEIRGICKQLAKPMADVALAWLLAQQGVTSVIAGVRKPQQIQQNVKAAELELSPDVIQRLSEVTEPVKKAIGKNADMWMHESRMEKPPAWPRAKAA